MKCRQLGMGRILNHTGILPGFKLLLSAIWITMGIFPILISAQVQQATFSLEPQRFGENDTVTIVISHISPQLWNVGEIYLWAWSFDRHGENPMDAPGNGTWNNSGSDHLLIQDDDGNYTLTFIPSQFFGRVGIGKVGFLAKAKDGNGDKKTQDFVVELGKFQFELLSPQTSRTILESATEVHIQARTSENTLFSLYSDTTLIFSTESPQSQFEFEVKVEENTWFTLYARAEDDELTTSFTIWITPEVPKKPLPSHFRDGINLFPDDSTSLALVLFAPHKSSAHVIGNFNQWRPNSANLMNLDTARNRFWISLSDLDIQEDILFQYLVDYKINIADPYSNLILDPNHDFFLEQEYWPDLPDYPSAYTNQAVSWVRQPTQEYNWEISDFTPPDRGNLIIYELLVRDFDIRHNFDAVIERLDYLQDLGFNAIELMPVNEFDGNESWGYNPSFHLALDKYYGTPKMFKRFVDACHKRGIAVILDVVFNHATGQNPYVRMWNDCEGCTEGNPSAENPFFNTKATHSYSVFHDFNHQSEATQAYVQRAIEYWITEFRIDGFRWDLTKGFTQNCTGSQQEACTNTYQADRVEVLQSYADHQWNLNPEFLIIFEHLGVGSSRQEEEIWANYRKDEGLGILLWNNLNYAYSEAAMGYHDGGKSNFGEVYGKNRNLPVSSTISYMESHDEERLMFKMLEYGHSTMDYQITSLGTALNRAKLAACFFFTLPGPKMVWQFGELGYDVSIDFNGRTGNKPIRWEYKDDSDRLKLYNTYKALIELRKSHEIFTSEDSEITTSFESEFKRIEILHPDTKAVIVGNFGVTDQNVKPSFPKDGMWYEYFTSDILNVIQTDTVVTLNPGGFRIYTTTRFDPPVGDILTTTQAIPKQSNQSGPVLFQNRPNPFTQSTIFRFSLPSATHAKLEIYDIRGRKISTVVDAWHLAGDYEITSTNLTLDPGVYFYHLNTNNHSVVQKMIHH